MAHVPGKESAATGGAGGAAAADRNIRASARASRTFGGSLLRLAAGAGAAYGLWHMWQHSEEPLPKPASEALSHAVEAASGGAARQQVLEEIHGSYPGSSHDVPTKSSLEAQKQQRR